MKYLAVQRYASGLYPGGFAAGDQINLDDALAADINRDAPGTLVLTVAEPEPVAPRQVDAPPADRMHRAPARKRGD